MISSLPYHNFSDTFCSYHTDSDVHRPVFKLPVTVDHRLVYPPLLRDHVHGGTQILGHGASTYLARDELFSRVDIGFGIAVSGLLSLRDTDHHFKRPSCSADTTPEHKFGSMYLCGVYTLIFTLLQNKSA